MLLIITAGSVADEVESLRGTTAIDEESVEPVSKRWRNKGGLIDRNYEHQPPLAPHAIDGFAIDLDSNDCLMCHSWASYSNVGATKISRAHFADHEEDEPENVAGQRYFCKQCHVAQKDAEPLVGNSFEPVKADQQ
jgi:cytochrome c-type protein NapB